MVEKDKVNDIVTNGSIKWQKHALQRMFERNITRDRVKKAILNGKFVKYYGSDRPYPSILIVDKDEDVILVVVSVDIENKICYVITAYHPDSEHFEDDMVTRRKQ